MRRRPLPPVREETSNKTKWRTLSDSDWLVYALVASVGALTYANSLHGEFVHDDIPAIVTNRDVTGANPLYKILANDFWGTPMSDPGSHKSYRPLTTLTFRINYALCGLSPWWWHATNVALHAACCVLVVRVAARLVRLARPAAALAGLLFAVHPVHTEAVAGIVGRADVLACLFFLSSILVYHGGIGIPSAWRSIALAALGMLAKETALTALLVNSGLEVRRWIMHGHRPTGLVWRVLRLVLATAVLGAARLALLQGSLPAFSPMDNPPAFHPSLLVRALTFSYLASLNWWLLLCPWSLSHDWQLGSVPLVTTLLDPRVALTALAATGLAALVYACWRDVQNGRAGAGGVCAALLLLLAPYMPASNLLLTVGFVVAERVLYMPSVGSVMLTAYGVQQMVRRSSGRGARLIALSCAALATVQAARTLDRSLQWRTRETLLRADLAVLPHNAKLHYNFGNFLKDIDQPENAIKHYKEALRLWPSYASAHNNLGTLVVPSGRAEYHFLQALKYNRDHVNAHYNLGKLYRKTNRIAESVTMLERCVSLAPRSVPALLELLLLRPQHDKRALLQAVLRLEPTNWEHRLLYGNWLKGRGLKVPALKYYLEALRLASRLQPARRGAELAALRAAGLLLRDLGQRARLLQLISSCAARWGGAARWRRLVAWRLRAELAGRARRYLPRGDQITSTCLHHSQLEVSPERYVAEAKNIDTNPSVRTLYENSDRLRDTVIPNAKVKQGCQSEPPIGTKKSVSIASQYKPIHNKSESGGKGKSCPLRKNKNNKDEKYSPYISDHLIKTY